MVESSVKLDHGEIMSQLFGEVIGDLAEDGFEGSSEEHQIFKQIFYGNPSVPTNCGGSSTKDSSGLAYEITKVSFEETNALKSFQESYSSFCAGPSAHNVPVMQGKLSYTQHLKQEMKGAEHPNYLNAFTKLAQLHPYSVTFNVPTNDPLYKPTSSTVHLVHGTKGYQHNTLNCVSDLPTTELDKESIQCSVIETLEQGILSINNLFSNYSDMDATGHINDGVVSNYKHTVDQMEDVKVVEESKYANSPVSQESVAKELMATSASLDAKEFSRAITCAEQSAEPMSSENADAGVKSKRLLKRDLPCRLESYAHCLLIDAGWKIEPRRRNDRTKAAYFFINSKERLRSKALTVAWKACGQKLLASASNAEQDANGREWWDVDSFWKDMTDTMAYIDKEAHHQESSLSLLHRWQLLDPFMAVVWIDRKLCCLRGGHGLKVVKSTTFILDDSRRVDVAEIEDNQVDKNAREVSLCTEDSGRRRKRSSWLATYAHPYSSLNENTYLSSLDETPSSGPALNSRQMNMQLEAQWPSDQACKSEGNIFSSTDSNLISIPAFQEFSSLPKEASSVPDMMVGSEAAKLKPKWTAAVPSAASAKKAHKKPEKVLEIREGGVIDTGVEIKLHDVNCRGDFFPNMVDKKDQQLDLIHHQKETSSPISELSSECLQQVELFKKKTGHHTSSIDDVKMTAEINIHRKPVKSKPKTARQSVKKKGNSVAPMEDQVHALSEVGKEHDKSTKSGYKAKRLTSNEFNPFSSKKQKVALKLKVAHEQLVNPNVGVSPDNGSVPCEDDCDEVLSTSCSLSSGHLSSQKPVKANMSKVNKQNGKKIYRRRINDDDLLISAIIKKKEFGSCSKQFSQTVGATKTEALRKLRSQKGHCMLLPRALKKGGSRSLDGRRITLGPRTVLCWLIEMGAVSLKDVVQYQDPKDNTVLKDGWVTRAGILCRCCTLIFSVSEFKTHAGLKQQRPSLNLFTQSGKPYTLCQLEAWSAEFKRRKSQLGVKGIGEKDDNDDTCGLCGDGGDLICCDNCPSTYHQTCLSAQDLPEGSWYCPNCICVTCGDLVNGEEATSSLAVLQCAQCDHKYHSSCIAGNIAINGEIGSGAWFCGESCQEVYLGLRSRVGVVNYIDDGYSWTILRCSHDDKKVCSAQKIALMAECNTKLAISLTLMEECFLPMVDPRTGIDMIPHVLYNMGSPFTRLNYHGFYNMVLEKGDQLISTASIRVHGAAVAEMPLISTCRDHRRRGMCQRLLNGIEKMLISFKVKMLVLSAIPSLVETWTSGFGFKPVKDEDKQLLSKFNLVLFPGTILLKKNLHVASSSQEAGIMLLESHIEIKNFGNAEENINFHSREQQSHNVNTLNGDQSTENSKFDLDAKSLLSAITNTQVDQGIIQHRETLMTYSESCISPATHNEHDAGSNAETCLNKTSANVNKPDRIFSVDQVAECQRTACKISCDIISDHTTHGVIIPDMKEKRTSQNNVILDKNNSAVAMNAERTIPFEGDEVTDKILVENPWDKNDAILSDEKAEKGLCSAITQGEVPNAVSFNNNNAVTTRNMEASASQNVNTLTESIAVNLTNNDTKIPNFVGEVDLNEMSMEVR